ncbi:MAG: PQQ-binding-like beta-propeller repeat protein [Planctomycetota bacterium]|nr:PQQ-binding-like beta-propeller repeat protein [Planctomycetota bacterium]
MRRIYITGLMLAMAVALAAWSYSGIAQQPTLKQSTTTQDRPAGSAAVPDLGTRKQGTDWPFFLGPTADSKSTERGIAKEWPKDGPPVVWQKQLGTGYGAPTISRGRLFQFDRFGDQARLTCFNSETGQEIWRFEYPTDYEDMLGYNNGPRCSPIVDDDRVYIFGAEGMLHCLNVVDGKLIWKLDTSKNFHVVQNFFGVGCTTVIEGDLLITQIGGSPEKQQALPPGQLDRVKGDGSGVVAFDKRTGEVKYQISDELASYAGPTLATIDGRRWCFVFARGGLLGFNPADGKIDFHYPWRAKLLESVNASNPIVFGRQVFITETYGPGSSLLSVRPGGYDVVWKDPANPRAEKSMQAHFNTPIHVGGHIYGSSGRHHSNAELKCIEAETGKVKWSKPDLTRSSLLLVDNHFICLTEDGELLLLKVNPEKYEELARVRVLDPKSGERLIEYPAWSAPILSHGLLYIRGKDRLVCLELIPEMR